MKETLQRLEGCPGVLGAVVMTLDGVLVTDVGDLECTERIAAFVSTMLLSMERDAETLGFVPLKRMTLWAARGRLVIVPMREVALVVIADRETDLAYASMEIEGLAQRLLRMTRFEV